MKKTHKKQQRYNRTKPVKIFVIVVSTSNNKTNYLQLYKYKYIIFISYPHEFSTAYRQSAYCVQTIYFVREKSHLNILNSLFITGD